MPSNLLYTITADNGKEFSFHEEIVRKLEVFVYFAKPYHSWERGVNEIVSEVSLTAKSFFENKGYEVVNVQKRKANRLELKNFRMKKVIKKEQ